MGGGGTLTQFKKTTLGSMYTKRTVFLIKDKRLRLWGHGLGSTGQQAEGEGGGGEGAGGRLLLGCTADRQQDGQSVRKLFPFYESRRTKIKRARSELQPDVSTWRQKSEKLMHTLLTPN